jgi:hypothetical protein
MSDDYHRKVYGAGYYRGLSIQGMIMTPRQYEEAERALTATARKVFDLLPANDGMTHTEVYQLVRGAGYGMRADVCHGCLKALVEAKLAKLVDGKYFRVAMRKAKEVEDKTPRVYRPKERQPAEETAMPGSPQFGWPQPPFTPPPTPAPPPVFDDEPDPHTLEHPLFDPAAPLNQVKEKLGQTTTMYEAVKKAVVPPPKPTPTPPPRTPAPTAAPGSGLTNAEALQLVQTPTPRRKLHTTAIEEQLEASEARHMEALAETLNLNDPKESIAVATTRTETKPMLDKIANMSASLRSMADELDNVALDIEQRLQAIERDTQKLKQLKELLMGL